MSFYKHLFLLLLIMCLCVFKGDTPMSIVSAEGKRVSQILWNSGVRITGNC